MIEPLVFTGGMAQTNGYLFEAPEGWVLVDAPEGVRPWIEARAIKPRLLLLTHPPYASGRDARSGRMPHSART